MKTYIYFLLFLLLEIRIATAQTQSIHGLVISAADQQPVAGATVRLKGSFTGTVTDIYGHFSLQSTDTARTLIISFVGMKTQEVSISPYVKVVLQMDEQYLDEVVITAIGIERNRKSLGYASTVVTGDELTRAREDNLLNALSGKVAGVRVTSSSGTPGGASKIQIRGASSISSASSPLFVIDGMPVDNTAYNPDEQVGNIDAGNRAGDISVDDIETINILKGGAAAALYGARAKDGAIIITTKRGNRNTRASITINSSTRFDQIAKLPDFQNEYAQGSANSYNLNATNGWGPNIAEAKAAGTKYLNHKGEMAYLEAYPDNVKDFFQTGISYMNNISLASGNEKTDFRAGISSYNQKGVIPGLEYNRYNFSVNAGTDLLPGLSARMIVQYILNDSQGRPAQGSNDSNTLLSKIYLMPRTVDMHYLKNNWIDEKGKQILLSPQSTSNNPFWIIHKNKYTGKLDRFIGNIVLSYSPIANLTVSNNAGMDYYLEKRQKIYAKGTMGEMEGKFQNAEMSSRLINNDLIITYEKKWKDFGFKGIAGHNIQQKEWSYNTTSASDLTVDGLYTYANAKQTTPSNYYEKKRLIGIYFDLGFNYKSIAFLNFTGRNDWSSTLPVANRSYFYPSVSGSFVFSELLNNQRTLNFGKIRLNYANVGSDTAPYQLKYQYTAMSDYTLQYSIVNTFPHNGLLGFSGPTTLPPERLKPQNQSAFEIGTELIFLNNRIRLDVTYYRNVTTNQIVSVRVPASTGYYKNQINAGKLTNKGIEIMLGLTPLKLHDFQWDININFAANKQIVNKITDNLNTYSMALSFNNVAVGAEKGKSFGLYGKGWLRDEAGNYLINEETGLRKTTGDDIRFGSIFPKYTMGINNQLSYRNISLNFLIDIKQGGKLFSGTVAELRATGLAAETAIGREKTFTEQGVIQHEDGTSRPNDIAVKDMETYWNHIGTTQNTEGSIFNASYVKLRELTFSYQFPRKWLSKCFFQSLSLGFEGRNLWLIKSHVPHIDPEVNAFGPDSLGEGVEFYNVPPTRSLGLNIKLTI